MKHYISSILVASTLALLPLDSRAEDVSNLIPNPGFENAPADPATYSLFTAPDSNGANCRFTITSDVFHLGKQSALMQSDDFARFSLNTQRSYPVVAGDLYRIGVWVKAGADFQTQPGSPGVVIRLNPTAGTPPLPSVAGPLFVYPSNAVSQGEAPYFSPLPLVAPSLTEWKHLEAVIKVPAGVDSMAPTLFFWKAKGSLYVDDFDFEKVDSSMTATPLTGTAASP